MSARADRIVDLLLGRAEGLQEAEIAKALGLTRWQLRDAGRAAHDAGRLAKVHKREGVVVWATPAAAEALRKKLRTAAVERAREGQRRRRAAAKKAAPPAAGKLYDKDDFNIHSVKDMPVVQRRVAVWPQVRVPPGPVSVFSLGAV